MVKYQKKNRVGIIIMFEGESPTNGWTITALVKFLSLGFDELLKGQQTAVVGGGRLQSECCNTGCKRQTRKEGRLL